jgi:hypothetical protein
LIFVLASLVPWADLSLFFNFAILLDRGDSRPGQCPGLVWKMGMAWNPSLRASVFVRKSSVFPSSPAHFVFAAYFSRTKVLPPMSDPLYLARQISQSSDGRFFVVFSDPGHGRLANRNTAAPKGICSCVAMRSPNSSSGVMFFISASVFATAGRFGSPC